MWRWWAVGMAVVLWAVGQSTAANFACPPGDVACVKAAIVAANGNGVGNRLTLGAGTYALTAVDNMGQWADGTDAGGNGLPVLTGRITMQGAGAGVTFLARDGSEACDTGHHAIPPFRLVHVGPTGQVNLEGLTLTGGCGALYDAWTPGGGILNEGLLRVLDSVIAGNSVDTGVGGGIWNSGTLHLFRSRVVGNSGEMGGGLTNEGTAVVFETTVAGNTEGGGIANHGAMSIARSSILDNAGLWVGGVYNGTAGASVAVQNSTIARNSAHGVVGGGVMNWYGSVTLHHVTIVDNHVTNPRTEFSGGGVGNFEWSGDAPGTVTLVNTLVAGNTAVDWDGQRFTPLANDCGGRLTSDGGVLVGTLAGCLLQQRPGDLVGEAGVGTFVDDGGPGRGVFPLVAGSLAIDAGVQARCLAVDQLGTRRQGPCDIGSLTSPREPGAGTLRGALQRMQAHAKQAIRGR